MDHIPPQPRDTLKRLRAELPVNVTLHIWLKAVVEGTPGALSISNANGKFAEVNAVNAEENSFRICQIFAGGLVDFEYDTSTTSVSVLYWFTQPEVMEKGITVVHTNPANAPPHLPDSYHFRPPFGWMNDPNGFGRFHGRPHLFYQHYSHGLRWNTMHWGHAVSDDYLRWRHLPIFLFPSEDLLTRPDKRGGAFSGSAIPLADGPGIRVFFTEQVADRVPETQIQLTATSTDLTIAGQAETILGERPAGQGLTMDFRDPYVFRGPDGLWKMLLGSQSAEGGVILLYETDDRTGASGWRFIGKLLVETRMKTSAIECPCLVPLDGPATNPATRWALVFGLMHSEDLATGRRNLTAAQVGWFDGKAFVKEFEQELDFAADCYAFQAFDDGGTAIGIGWLANWADASPEIDFPSAMTLPRELHLSGGALCTPPAAGVESLRAALINDCRISTGETVSLEHGAAEILIEFAEAGTPFALELSHPSLTLAVVADAEGLFIRYETGGAESAISYIAAGARPKTVRVFLDYGSIEVFADDGRWTGTKRIDGFEPVRAVRLVAPEGAVARSSIWALRL
ncbi:glycoside hydrolase family 32 protein [Sinorhizobium sp. BG8]|uniref:GH32 C-terminal domain-containing protein n=1 Tax=Sinorhizobium sp. BG8 TaxID=2613773 RepID=UPI00193DA797|nr:glycoside hydrolase family 32 protein [Sinorhizobium sp. BG8]QRM54120.1 glycoside hydrolase family 32 protein [Sinorhizobium sp. BG8]